MRVDTVDWRAEDSEAGAQRIGGRPAQAFWRRLRPCFRGVLLEPHRRAGEGRVSWRWTGPSEPGAPGAAELTGLRRRLGTGLADLAADLERDEEAGGAEARDLHAGMETLVTDLINAPDARLAGYAIRTEAGWMIRSWGIARPSPARRAGESDATETAAESSSSAEAADADRLSQVVAETDALRPGRRWRPGLWLGAGLGMFLGAVAWFWPGGRADAENLGNASAPAPLAADSPSRPATKPGVVTAGARSVAAQAPREAGAAHQFASVGSAPPPQVGQANGATDGSPRIVPVPMAYTGPIGTPPEAAPRPVDGQGELTRGGSAGAGGELVGPGDARPAKKSSDEAKVAADPGKAVSRATAYKPDAVREPHQGSKPLELGEATARTGEGWAGPVPLASEVPEFAAAPPEGDASRREPPAGNTPGASGRTDITGGSIPTQAGTSATGVIGDSMARDTASPDVVGGRGPEFASWVCHLGQWRLARTRDVALPTMPAEAGQEGGAREALAQARRRAWDEVRAALPDALRSPVTRAGWVFRFRSEAVGPLAPRWVQSAGTGRGGLAAVWPDRAEMTWAEPAPQEGFEARLLGPDGVEWARLRVDDGGRRLGAGFGVPVREAAPWFEVAGAAQGTTGTGTAEGRWRSLGPGWPDTRWRRDADAGSARVVCFAVDPDAAPPTAGVVAWEHLASGWALAREVRLEAGR